MNRFGCAWAGPAAQRFELREARHFKEGTALNKAWGHSRVEGMGGLCDSPIPRFFFRVLAPYDELAAKAMGGGRWLVPCARCPVAGALWPVAGARCPVPCATLLRLSYTYAAA